MAKKSNRRIAFSLLLSSDEKRRYAAAAKDDEKPLGAWIRDAAQLYYDARRRTGQP